MEEIYRYLANYKKTGEKKWFDKVYKYFMPKIYNYFYFNTMDSHISEDLSSEVFFKIYKNLNTVNLNSKTFNAWIFKIAKNHLIDHCRKKKKDNENIILTDWQDNDNKIHDFLIDDNFLLKKSNVLKKELGFDQKILEAMEKLTALQRNIVIMIFILDLDYKTIADIMMKKQSTIRGILFRAINILKNEINHD